MEVIASRAKPCKLTSYRFIQPANYSACKTISPARRTRGGPKRCGIQQDAQPTSTGLTVQSAMCNSVTYCLAITKLKTRSVDLLGRRQRGLLRASFSSRCSICLEVTECVLDPVKHVLQNCRLGKCVIPMTEIGVKDPAVSCFSQP